MMILMKSRPSLSLRSISCLMKK